MSDPKALPPPINPSKRVRNFQDPIVLRAVSVLQKQLAVQIPESGIQRVCCGVGASGISVQILCLVSGRDSGLWTFEVWGKPDGSWEITYSNKQGGEGAGKAV